MWSDPLRLSGRVVSWQPSPSGLCIQWWSLPDWRAGGSVRIRYLSQSFYTWHVLFLGTADLPASALQDWLPNLWGPVQKWRCRTSFSRKNFKMVTGEHETRNGAPGLQWLHVREAAAPLTGNRHTRVHLSVPLVPVSPLRPTRAPSGQLLCLFHTSLLSFPEK